MAGQASTITVPGGGGKPPSAVVLLPWLGERTDQSVSDVARCLAMALDRVDPERGDRFAVAPAGGMEKYGVDGEHTTNVRRILRTVAGGQAQPCVDVYDAVYAPEQTAWFDAKSIGVKAGSMLWSLIFVMLRRMVGAVWPKWSTKRALSRWDKAQVLLALFFMLLMTTYAGILIAGVVAAVYAAVKKQSTVAALVHPAALSTGPLTWTGWLQVTALGAAAAGLGSPKKWKQAINEAAINYRCALAYLNEGTGRGDRVGHLTDLLEHLVESSTYERIDVVAYSFGSLIALDAFFPPAAPPPPVFSRVHTLVTIGCPADFVRLFWPKYYKDRSQAEGIASWVNVYSRLDLLSSNFRNDGEIGDASLPPDVMPPRKPSNKPYLPGLLGQKPGPFTTLRFMGLRSHAMYWPTAGTGSDSGCFELVARELYSSR